MSVARCAISLKRLPRLGALELLSLYSLAVVQPLYDLLGRYPTFLSAHSLRQADLFWYLCGVSFVIPAIVVLLLAFIYRVAPRTTILCGWALAAGLLILLSSFITPQVFGQIEGVATVILVGLMALSGVVLLATVGWVREGLRLAAVAAFVLPMVLVFQLPASYTNFIRSQSAITVGASAADLDLPQIVMLVFDELPLTALVNSDLEVRRELFPNLAGLAESADWYVQASTVASRTRLALPALLTGQIPNPAYEPNIDNHPTNLFTILAADYSLHVDEPASALCGANRCTGEVDWLLTAQDTALVYAHVVTPAFLAVRLPVLTGQWSSFFSESSNVVHDERIVRFEDWFDRLDSAGRPNLHFLHSLLPHIPYTTLPTNHRLFRHGPTVGHVTSSRRDELSTEKWADVEARYLFLWQVKLVDRMVGRVVARLKELGTFDDTLLVVTADHGVRLAPGMSRRQPFAEDYIDIAAVPLFVKRPGQRAPRRIERPFQSIELLPLMLEIIGLDAQALGVVGPGSQQQSAPRRIRSYLEYIDLPETLDLRTGLQWWPADEQISADLALPQAMTKCKNSVELVHPELYQSTHPQHFLAAHLLMNDPQERQTEVVVEFNGGLWRALRSAPGKWSAFVSPDDFAAGFNALRIAGKTVDDRWCLLYENAPP